MHHVCDNHREDPIEAIVISVGPKYTRIELKCPHVYPDQTICNRFRGIRLIPNTKEG